MDNHSLLQLLSKTRVFAQVESQSLEKLIAAGKIIHAPSGTIFLEEGKLNLTLHIVLKGKVRVYLPQRSGNKIRIKDVDIAKLGPGSCFGEYSVMDMEPTVARVMAVEETSLLIIEKETLEKLIRENSIFGSTFYQNLLKQVIGYARRQIQVTDVYLPWEDNFCS